MTWQCHVSEPRLPMALFHLACPWAPLTDHVACTPRVASSGDAVIDYWARDSKRSERVDASKEASRDESERDESDGNLEDETPRRDATT